MTKNKRFTVNDRWIKDNFIGALLNIDFNTITDANLCCDLLNQIEKEKRNNGKLASKLLGENEQLKNEIEKIAYANEDLLKEKMQWEKLSDEYAKLYEENEQLKQDKTNLHRAMSRDRVRYLNENEELKTIRSDLISELDIVQNELNIAIDEGFAPSTSYKNYMASKKTEYDKFWENKIKTHNNTLKELKE